MDTGWRHIPRPFALPQHPPLPLLGDVVPGHGPVSSAPSSTLSPLTHKQGPCGTSIGLPVTPKAPRGEAPLSGLAWGGSRDRPCSISLRRSLPHGGLWGRVAGQPAARGGC